MSKSKVCVVMSTFNGEKYLKEQVDSIMEQKDVHVILYVRDDGSKDGTVRLLKELYIGIIVEEGKNCGAKTSFLKALSEAPDAEYYAFADQDDVWDEDKLIIAIKKIQEEELRVPGRCILYCGRTRLVDENLNAIVTNRSSTNVTVSGFLRGQPRKPAGCTMVLNKALRDEITKYIPTVFPMHDAWVYNVCLAVGGSVIYDPYPHINYRQHGNNAVGGKRGVFVSIKRRLLFYKNMGKCYHTKMFREIAENQQISKANMDRYIFVSSYMKSAQNKLALLRDKEFMRGDLKYRIETFLLVVFNAY